MQKLRIMSDLHLEFGRLVVPELPEDKETILILAGDIHVGDYATTFIDAMAMRFQDVIYVLGNHEFYHNDMEDIRLFWRRYMKYNHNLHVLDPGIYVNDAQNLRIIGATLWTETQDPAMQNYLNDYAVIQREHRVLTVQDTRNLFLDDLDYITARLAEPFDGTTIVVTHHAPVQKCVAPNWVGHVMNPCFHSNLDDLIEANDIELWVHGHMHQTIHTTLHGTEIYCNPRGYKGHSANYGFRDDFVIEL